MDEIEENQDTNNSNDKVTNFIEKDKIKQKYPCDICSFVCATRTSYKNHRETHSETNNYKCKVCEKTFKTKSVLTFHS